MDSIFKKVESHKKLILNGKQYITETEGILEGRDNINVPKRYDGHCYAQERWWGQVQIIKLEFEKDYIDIQKILEGNALN